MNLLDRAKAYANGVDILARWLGSGGKTVEHNEAQRRANGCLACPQNQPGLKVAESVSAEVRRQVELKNNLLLRVEGEKSLHTCAACLCPLRLKVWIPLERILPDEEEKQKLDPNCWLLKTV